jgi:hypothetical protein
MLRYSRWSTGSSSSSASKVAVLPMGVDIDFTSCIWNFLSMSFVYLVCCTNVSSSLA